MHINFSCFIYPKEVFNQVDSFYDICFEILKCFFDPSNKKNIKNNKDWLKENKINHFQDIGIKIYID